MRLIALAIIILVLPLVSSSLIIAVALIVSSLLANDGLNHKTVGISLAALIGLELIWGLPLGMFSLAYAATLAIFYAGSLILSLRPFVDSQGWHFQDFLRSWLISLVLSAIMLACSIFIFSDFYSFGSVGTRLLMAWHGFYIYAPWICALLLLTLRRIDVPFRRTIKFGQ